MERRDELREHSIEEMRPQDQFEIMTPLEQGDKLTVSLLEHGTAGGKITSVVENGATEDPQELYVQFLDFQSEFRQDDKAHHAVTIERSEDGEWECARLIYSVTDDGRVRQEEIDEVTWILPRLNRYIATDFETSEQRILSLLEIGFSEQEVAEIWGCDESEIQKSLQNIRQSYNTAKKTVEALDSSSINIETAGPGAGSEDWSPFDGDDHSSVSQELDSDTGAE